MKKDVVNTYKVDVDRYIMSGHYVVGNRIGETFWITLFTNKLNGDRW